MHRKGFTLIELLVVVAVLVILAAIAVPNFLEAQVRSKVARSRADMATLVTALESYAVDNNTYPLNAGGIGLPGALYNLLNPIAYISELPTDVFLQPQRTPFLYLSGGPIVALGADRYGAYVLAGAGPDKLMQTSFSGTLLYDPTNGSVSAGDVVMTQRTKEHAAIPTY